MSTDDEPRTTLTFEGTLAERIALLREGADEMRKDRDPRWHAIADWADLEAATLGETEAFVELINVGIEKQSGVKGYLRLMKTPDGDPALANDTSEGAVMAVLSYLGET